MEMVLHKHVMMREEGTAIIHWSVSSSHAGELQFPDQGKMLLNIFGFQHPQSGAHFCWYLEILYMMALTLHSFSFHSFKNSVMPTLSGCCDIYKHCL